MSISGIQELMNDLKKIHRYEIVKHLEACNEMLKIREKTSLAHVHAPLKILELKDPVIELLKDPENERLEYLVAEAAKNMYQTYFAQLRPRTFPTERLSNQLDTLKKVTKHQNIPEIEELSERLNQVRQVMLDLDHS